MRQDITDTADLLAALSAIRHPVEDTFDPQRFLEAFSHHLAGLIPHDGAMIAHLEDDGRRSTVFAEYRRQGPNWSPLCYHGVLAEGARNRDGREHR